MNWDAHKCYSCGGIFHVSYMRFPTDESKKLKQGHCQDCDLSLNRGLYDAPEWKREYKSRIRSMSKEVRESAWQVVPAWI